MSVLVKGMKMPKCCYDCELIDVVESCPCYSMTLAEFIEFPWIRKARHRYCPLVELPQHGDLVDKQKMAETNEQHYKIFEGEENADYARQVVLQMLDQAPVIIEAENDDIPMEYFENGGI